MRIATKCGKFPGENFKPNIAIAIFFERSDIALKGGFPR